MAGALAHGIHGVFDRAEGLWEEIGADLFAETAQEALKVALTDRRAEPDMRKQRRKAARTKVEEHEEEPVAVE